MASKKVCNKRLVIVVVLVNVCIVAIVAVLLGVFVSGSAGDEGTTTDAPSGPSPSQYKSRLGVYKQAAVATDEGRCSTVGKTIMLEKNGSAVDAAVATMLCIGVLNAHSMGIGGGSFMVVYERQTQTVVTFDFRESAPSGSTENMYTADPDLKLTGGLSIGVPGEVRGYWAAHERFGRLPWRQLFEPAIKLCAEGFKLGEQLAGAIRSQEKYVRQFEGLREVFVNKETDDLIQQGDVVHFPKLAQTLRAIATEGPDAFYNGSLTKAIVDDIKDAGGIITESDLNDYKVKTKEPLVGDIDGLKIYGVRPPSSGALIHFILKIMEGYKSQGLKKDNALSYHRIAESFKFAFAKRNQMGDEDYTNLTSFVDKLMSKEYADSIRGKIWDNMTHGYDYYGPTYLDKPTVGTSHANILSPDGDAVAITSTINYFLGSKIRGKRTGILFNNEMMDFYIPTQVNSMGISPLPVNLVKPGKRPVSSMCPTIMVDANGDVRYVIGASGGSRITTATAYTLVRSLWFGDVINDAIDARRLHHQLLPSYVNVEQDFPQFIIDDLKDRHHNVSNSYKLSGTGSSIVQAIHVQGPGEIYAVSDFRKTGYPDGF